MAKARRIYVSTTPERKEELRHIREQLDREKDEILAQGREAKRKIEREEAYLRSVVQELRQRREQQGISLADMQARTGMTRESICKLENNRKANPTIKTIERYAEALGLRVVLQFEPIG